MRIERAGIEDLPIVVKLKMKMFEEVGSIKFLQDDVEEKIGEVYGKLYQEDKCCHYLLYEEDEVVAIGGAVIKEDVPFCFFKTPYYGYVVDVYCIPEERKKGYATQIMKKLMEWLETKGCHSVKLKPSEAGRKMYGKLGFYDSGEMGKWI
jgi:predicted GNAT family acetyltransferase